MSIASRILGIFLAASLGNSASAADPKPLIDCWDQSFAYTFVGIRKEGASYRVALKTQNEPILRPLIPGQRLRWGRASMQAVFPEKNCEIDAGQKRFRCSGVDVPVSFEIGRPHSGKPLKLGERREVVTVEFMSVERVMKDEHAKEPRLLLIRTISDKTERTLVALFGYGSDCGGFRSAFDRR